MDVVSSSPLRVGSIVWRSPSDAWALTVVCKATYLLTPGESKLAPDQDEINEADVHWNDDARRSLHVMSDLAPFKPRSEVLLTGHVFAPEQRPVTSLVARLSIADVNKSIEVFGDRAWTQGGVIRGPTQFTKMPFQWERAGGGPGTSNPVGVRADAPPDMYGARAMPNFQPPGLYATRPGELIEPVGLGPIAPTWPGRLQWLYKRAEGWSHQRWSERPLPSDIDARYFNAAPPDQQLDAIRSDERIVLEHLHPRYARLVTSLAPVTPRATAERAGGARAEIALRCDTLCIDTDRGICALVWRGQVGIWHPRDEVRVVVTVDSGAPRAAKSAATETIASVFEAGDETLPLAPDGRAGAQKTSILDTPVTKGTLTIGSTEAKPALPFVQGRSDLLSPESPAVAAIVAQARQRGDLDGTGTLVPQFGVAKAEVLPFAASPVAPRIPPGAPVAAEPPEDSARAAAFAQSPFDPVAEPWSRGPGEPPPEPLAEPAMIGPLATPEMALKAPTEGASLDTPETGAPAKAAAAIVAKPPLPLDAFPIERCAAIAASLARRKADAPRILEENELTPATWGELDGHWNGAIRDEIRRGKTALLQAYDAAYVGQLEKERGALRVEEYAKLQVASERGTTADVLAALTLPKGAVMRIERVWLGRLEEDAKLAASLAAAVDAAREDGE